MLTNLKTAICAIFVIILHLELTRGEVSITNSTVPVVEEVAVPVPAGEVPANAVVVPVAGGGEVVVPVSGGEEPATDGDEAGATCFAETKNMYFPLETRHCCKHLKLKCQATTEQDHFCLLKTEEEFKAFGDCCKTKAAGRGIEVDPDPPGAKDCAD